MLDPLHITFPLCHSGHGLVCYQAIKAKFKLVAKKRLNARQALHFPQLV